MLSHGVKVHFDVTVGKDISVANLQEDFDSIYIAIGAQMDKKIGMEGKEAE